MVSESFKRHLYNEWSLISKQTSKMKAILNPFQHLLPQNSSFYLGFAALTLFLYSRQKIVFFLQKFLQFCRFSKILRQKVWSKGDLKSIPIFSKSTVRAYSDVNSHIGLGNLTALPQLKLFLLSVQWDNSLSYCDWGNYWLQHQRCFNK